ncbi:TonB-dependent receptor [Novosphingobium flavum]|uniref:TonB-dependent receptor n=1 Tax=Novosphingobium flavum TaxID=1778672 RepID=A0A7X1FUD2_9SPHN|nr:TonB-dependent receptor [Novosphingobium flavum]MBC2667014.1 TonB-dependent receptor [Novosphingobium flavum]
MPSARLESSFKLTAKLLGGACLLSLIQPELAFSQTMSGNQENPGSSEAPASEAIVVTGSRIVRNGNESPSPVTVVQTQDILQMRPGVLSEALSILPVFAGSKGTTSNPSTTGPTVGGNGNANQLNLRNLGPNRTLVLLDGYRVPPTSFNNIVDVDIMPQMLIQRVDTVTGGVSAVYGSDAVAGVVNYILDKKFQGLRLQANSGISQLGDARKVQAGVAYGRNLLDNRAHFEASYEYILNEGIPARSDRSFLNQIGMTGAGTSTNPYLLQRNLRQAGFPFGGLITNGLFANQVFGTDGTLHAFQNGTTTGSSGIQVGGEGGYFDATLAGKLYAHQFFGRFDYEVSDALKAYVQVSGNHKLNQNWSDPLRLNRVTISATDPFLAQTYRTQLANANQSTFLLSQLGGNNTRLDSRSLSDQWIISGGLDGSFGKDWQWGVNYSYNQSILNVTLNNNPDYQRLAAALDAVTNSSNQIVCNITITNPTAPVAQGCVPYNPFGQGAASQASLNYILTSSTYRAVTRQNDVTAHIAGSPFSSWAGPVKVALSAEWRRLAFSAKSSLHPTDLRDCTGLRFNCSSTATISDFTFPDNPKISQSVSEGAIEVEIPLLKDVPLVQELSLNGAARYTHYDTSGNYWTWKIGGEWRVSDNLRFRATHSRDIRAPTLYELFAPASTIQVTTQDLLLTGGPTSFAPIVTFGNPTLTAEVAHTWTAGMVWRPTPRLSFTVDAYSIRIANAIATISGNAPSLQNACYDSGGTSYFCTLQARPGGYSRTAANMATSNAVTTWYGAYLNLAAISTKGIDAEVNYSGELFGGPMNLRLMAAYQPHIYYVTPGSPTIDQGSAGFGPSGFNPAAPLRIAGFFRFQPAEHFTVDILEKWRGAMKQSGDPTVTIVDNRISPFATTSLSFTADIGAGSGKAQVVFTIENLFNARPPAGGYITNGSRAGLRDGFVAGDDVVGRAFNIGVRAKF